MRGGLTPRCDTRSRGMTPLTCAQKLQLRRSSNRTSTMLPCSNARRAKVTRLRVPIGGTPGDRLVVSYCCLFIPGWPWRFWRHSGSMASSCVKCLLLGRSRVTSCLFFQLKVLFSVAGSFKGARPTPLFPSTLNHAQNHNHN